jgi:hypothetical protein
MSFLEKVLIGGGLAWLAKTMHRNVMEEQRRKNSPLSFDEGLTQEDFVNLATATAGRTPRVVGVTVVGMTVALRVQSNSGLSEWSATVDFNDYGHLSGRCWIKSENEDSAVPSHFASSLRAEIAERAPARERVEYPQAGPTDASDHAQAPAPPPPAQPPLGAPQPPAGWYTTDTGPRYWNGVGWSPSHRDYPMGHPPGFGVDTARRASATSVIVFAWIIAFASFGYMLPWAIAVTRGTSNRAAVGLVCFFTGWTFIGWIVALIMACNGSADSISRRL